MLLLLHDEEGKEDEEEENDRVRRRDSCYTGRGRETVDSQQRVVR
jgi:hypothetical protein